MENTRNNSLDAGLLTAEEKRAIETGELPHPTQARTERKRKVRPHVLVALVFGTLLMLGIAAGPRMASCVRHHRGGPPSAVPDDVAFTQLLDSADPETLRELLRERLPEKFQSGVFESDRVAAEVVHEDDAALASSIVKLAARQEDGGNNSTASSTSTDDEEKTTTTEDKDEPTSTPSSTKEDEKTTTTTEDKETTTKTTTSDEPEKTTSSAKEDDGMLLSTPFHPNPPLTNMSDSESSSPTPEKTSTRKKVTSTKADGTAVTITSYADAEQPTNDDSNDDDEEDPDLQDAGARPAIALLPVLGAAAGAFLML